MEQSQAAVAIIGVFPNSSGSRVVFVDSLNRGWLFSPVDDSKCLIDKFPPSIENVLWDANDPNMFVAVDTKVNTCSTS